MNLLGLFPTPSAPASPPANPPSTPTGVAALIRSATSKFKQLTGKAPKAAVSSTAPAAPSLPAPSATGVPSQINDAEWAIAYLFQSTRNRSWLQRAMATMIPSATAPPEPEPELKQAWYQKIAHTNTYSEQTFSADIYKDGTQCFDFDAASLSKGAKDGRWLWEAHSVSKGWLYIEGRIRANFRPLLIALKDSSIKGGGHGKEVRQARPFVGMLCVQAWNKCPQTSSPNVLQAAFLGAALEWVDSNKRNLAASDRQYLPTYMPVIGTVQTAEEADQVATWARAVARQYEFEAYRPEINILADRERNGDKRYFLLVQDRASSIETDGEMDIWK
ncbi:unnamed protein product [Sympodiomycopsis kandeliae]